MPPREEKLIFVPPGKGKSLKVLGESITRLVTSDETNGAYSVIDSELGRFSRRLLASSDKPINHL